MYRGEAKHMKISLPAIGGAAAGLVLYVLQLPSFLILIAAVGTALIVGARLWERRNPTHNRRKAA
jgi:hypothetical protein